MKTVTYEQFLTFEPCWLEDEEQAEELKQILTQKPAWTALDIVALPQVSSEDKLRAVLREEFIDANILHEFGCRVAEKALAKAGNPDPRSIAAIAAKRKWVKGKITEVELAAARSSALVAAWAAAWDSAGPAAGSAARSAAGSAERSAAGAATWYAAMDEAVQMLIDLLKEPYMESEIT